MANRRYGGPPQKGGFAQQNFQGNKVNPWQGGAAPNNSVNSGVLSQLSTPQAQLALAISSLLQPQQPVNNNPPSLLSLPTNPAFGNQDNFSSQNRFNSRGRDFRRPEPYKNRSGNAAWRDNSTRPTGSYGRSSSSNRSGSRFGNKDRKSPPKGGKAGKGNAKANKGKASGDKLNDSSKRVEKDEKSDVLDNSVDENRDEDCNEGEEKKREWKQEKNGEDDENVDSVDLTEEVGGEEGVKKQHGEKKPRVGRYHGVPASLLHCFVCNKSMWDGESFQNHIRGKAHKQMMDSLGQSFQITVNILRENMRLVEEKKMIELERVHRNSRSYHRQLQEPQSHCNMCDLKFLGKIITHRKTEGHQRLKRFLHPKCEYCCQEFPSRMEWVDHRFTPDHLRKIKEILDTRTRPEDGAPIEEEHPEMENDPLLDESLQTEDENPVLELSDDLKDLQNRIPAYKRSRGVATKNLQPMSGFYCDICVRFMTSEAVAQEHLRTELHYNTFVETAKKKYKKQQDEERAAADKAAKKRKAEEENEPSKKAKTDCEEGEGEGDGNEEDNKGDEMYDPEEACEENEACIDNVALDEEFAEVDRLISSTDQQENAKPEINESPKEPEEKKPEVVSPRARRGAAAAPSTTAPPVVSGSNVRNGAGPKSKTRRGGK